MRLAVLLVLVLGCASEATDPCGAAADHLATCTGASVRDAATTCDEERAEAVLEMSCEEVSATAAAGKADGWWDDFLCAIGFTDKCSDEITGQLSLTGSVYKLGTTDGADGVIVRAVPEAGGAVVKWSDTTNGYFALPQLPPGAYKLEVAQVLDGLTLTSKRVEFPATRYVVLYSPL